MSTLKTTNIQNASSATTNIALDTSGGVTVGAGITASNGTVVMSSPYTMRNKIINGAMVIDQRNAGASVTINAASSSYTLDRWLSYGQATDGVFTIAQSSTAPSGFSNSLLATVTTADASIGTTQIYIGCRQKIEGYNIADLAWGTSSALAVTLSFWVRSSIAGIYGGSIVNSSQTRSFPFSFTINSPNTFEYKTIIIPGDTTGTWLTNNGIGMDIFWSIGTGATYSGTAGAWAAGTYYTSTGATNLISTLGATLYITGVQLERGTVATPFEYRPYGIEMGMCQRYYWRITGASTGTFPGIGSGVATGATTCRIYIKHPVQMRAAATYSYGGGISVYDGTGNPAVSAISATYAGLDTSMLDITTASGLTLGRGVVANVQSTSADYIQANAEL